MANPSSLLSRRVVQALRLSAIGLTPLLVWALAEPRYRLPVFLGVPLLLAASNAAVFAVAGVSICLVFALLVADVPRLGDVWFVLAALTGTAFALRAHFFRPGLSNIVSRLPASIGAGAMGVAVVELMAALFRGVPWPAYLALAAGYAGLSVQLGFRPFTNRKRSIRRAVLNGSVLLLSTICAVTLLEVGARIFIDIPLPPPPARDTLEANDAMWWAPRPSTSQDYAIPTAPGTRKKFTVHHSSQGLRGPEIAPKEPGEFRVALVGDSFTYGWGVNDDDNLAGQLTRIAREKVDRPVTFLNLGVLGFSPWQEYEMLKQRGLPLQPDLVILQLFPANDILDTSLKIGVTLPVFGDRELAHARMWRRHTRWRERWEREWRSRSAAYNGWRATRPDLPGLFDLLARLRFIPRDREALQFAQASDRTYWLEVLLREWYPQLDEAWAAFQRDVKRIVELCDEKGIPVIVYTMPAQFFDDEAFGEVFRPSRAASRENVEYEPYKDTRIVEEFLAREQIHSFSLLDALKSLNRPADLFIPGDLHLNETGNRFVASILFDEILRTGLLRSREPAAGVAAP